MQSGFLRNVNVCFSARLWSRPVNLQKTLKSTQSLSTIPALACPPALWHRWPLSGIAQGRPPPKALSSTAGVPAGCAGPEPAPRLMKAPLPRVDGHCPSSWRSQWQDIGRGGRGGRGPVWTARIQATPVLSSPGLFTRTVLSTQTVNPGLVTLCRSGIKSWYNDRISMSRVRRRFWANVGVSKVAFSPLITKINPVRKRVTNLNVGKETPHSDHHPPS